MAGNDIEQQAGDNNADLADVTAELITTSRDLVRRATEAVAEVQKQREQRRAVQTRQEPATSGGDDSG